MSDLDERYADATRRLLHAGSEICELIATDVVLYPDRELERRFLDRPEIASRMQDATLLELRLRARALGASLAATMRERLGQQELWLGLADRDDIPEDGKDLQLMPPIWSAVASDGDALGPIDAAFEALASDYGLGGDEREPPGYHPPRRFIDRRYLPGLVESALRQIAALRRLRHELHARDVIHNQQTLSARWAAAAPKG